VDSSTRLSRILLKFDFYPKLKEINMGTYDEYLARSAWGPSEPLHNWIAKKILLHFSRVANLSPEKTDLLEIGTGIGRAAVQARNLGFRSYMGVEPTAALAEFSRKQHGIKILEDSLPNLKTLKDDSFDAVFSIHVLEHATTWKDAALWCHEMVRVLRPGGHLLIVAPDIRDYKENFWDSDWSHGYPTTPQRVSQLVRDVELELVHEGSMHLGQLGGISAVLAHGASLLLPTRLGDILTGRIVGRPLVSGFKIAVLWGTVFVVARKPFTT